MAWNEVVIDALKQINIRTGGTAEGKIYNASRRVLAVAAGANLDSIFLTASTPVLFFSRVVGRTGTGISASIYRDTTYTGGTVAETYNTNDLMLPSSSVVLRSDVTVTLLGPQTVATAYGLGNTSNQGQGSLTTLGEPLLMRPNTAYLLRLTSLDTQAQDISSMIAWYEGGL